MPGLDGPLLPAAYRCSTLDTVDSTNAELLRRAAAGEAAGLIVRAGSQTAGRGRLGRAWQSPAGNLYFSLMIDVGAAPAVAAQLSLVIGIAVADSINSVLGGADRAVLKWTNDVLIGGKKIAGMLLETAGPGAAGEGLRLIIGVGVNILTFPPDVRLAATSLRDAGADLDDAGRLMRIIVGQFETWRGIWMAHGFAPIRTAWLERAANIGAAITVSRGDNVLAGRFVGLDAEGALRLEDDKGHPHVIKAGDVYF